MRGFLGSGLVVLLALSACAADEAPLLGQRAAPVVNGFVSEDGADPAVVGLDLNGGLCTGTVVTPRTVLTAAHCVAGLGFGEIRVLYGNSFYAQGADYRATVRHESHPTADIAMITLAEPAPVTPIPIYFGPQAPLIGQDVRVVGFGITSGSANDAGRKRWGQTKLHHLEGDVQFTGYVGSGLCFGDSGGPNFVAIDGVEHVFGVHSFVQNSSCPSTGDGSVRTDTTRAFLLRYIAAVEDTAPPTLTVIAPQAGATVAPGTALELEIGDDLAVAAVELRVDGVYSTAATLEPLELSLPANIALGEHTVSVIARDWADREAQVDLALTVVAGCSGDGECCAEQSCLDGRCVLALGAPCKTHGECSSGQCNVGPDGRRACTQSCSDGCPDGFGCASATLGAPEKCWTGVGGGGGPCAVAAGRAGRGGSAAWLLAALAALAIARRRR